MKKRILLLTLLTTVSLMLTAQDAYEIVKRQSEQDSPRTTHALLQMVLTDQRGQQNERVIEQWSAVDNQGETHSVMVFQSPASVKDTRFLTKENLDRDNDQWIFLPALNQVRRIAGSEGDSSFMGSEFTYQDMNDRELDDYSYNYLGQETINGEQCYKIEALPNADTESSYDHSILWITVDESINIILRIEIYSSTDDLLKVYTVEEFEQIQGYWIHKNVTMANVQNQRSTSLIQQRVELDRPVNTQRFSQRFLETGRTE
jgi:hypothetical protein